MGICLKNALKYKFARPELCDFSGDTDNEFLM